MFAVCCGQRMPVVVCCIVYYEEDVQLPFYQRSNLVLLEESVPIFLPLSELRRNVFEPKYVECSECGWDVRWVGL